MIYKNKKAVFAAVMALAMLFSSCSSLDSPDKDITAPVTQPATSYTDQTLDLDIPQFLETTGPEQMSISPETAMPSNSMPPQSNDTPGLTQSVDDQGMIVDDWRSDVTISSPPDIEELYSDFGIDKSSHESYNTMISAECKLPIIHISTEGRSEILSLDDYVNCLVETLNCDDIYKIAATGGIRVRGNASAGYGDVDFIRNNIVSYRIKFDEQQPMLGLNGFARCRSWVLLKAYETGVRNLLAFKLADAINEGDYYVSDAAPVQVYINEDYAGMYILCEQTQENSERVDINEAENGYEGTDIGYLVELDNYASSDDDPFFSLVYNNEEITDCYGKSRVPRKYTYSVKNDLYSDEQLKFIERRFEIFWEIAMRAIKYNEYYKFDENLEIVPAQDEFSSAYECINAAIDVNSVVDMYITYEIVNDQDAGGGSFFFAVDYGADSKYPRLTMVAPWDFDWGYSDYHSDPDGGLYVARFKDDYFIDNWGDRSNPWLILFYSADWFKELVKEKWQARKPAIIKAMDDVEQTAVEYSDDFDKDGVNRSARSVATVTWTRDRVEYLSTLWG